MDEERDIIIITPTALLTPVVMMDRVLRQQINNSLFFTGEMT
jgi:hypothetical protein